MNVLLTSVAQIFFFFSLFISSFVKGSQIDLKEGNDVEFVYSLKQGTNWGLQFQVVEGYVAIKMQGPEGIIFEGDNEQGGSHSITAKNDGIYSCKISNPPGQSIPTKKVTLTILGNTTGAGRSLDPAQKELNELNNGLMTIRSEFGFLMQRLKKHTLVASNTNSKIMWWFLIQVALIGGVFYFQISSLKKFFEVRRVV